MNDVDAGVKLQEAEDDLAIVEFRRLMVDAAQKVAEGGRAIGTDAEVPQALIASHEGVYSKDVDWRTLVNPKADSQAAE